MEEAIQGVTKSLIKISKAANEVGTWLPSLVPFRR